MLAWGKVVVGRSNYQSLAVVKDSSSVNAAEMPRMLPIECVHVAIYARLGGLAMKDTDVQVFFRETCRIL